MDAIAGFKAEVVNREVSAFEEGKNISSGMVLKHFYMHLHAFGILTPYEITHFLKNEIVSRFWLKFFLGITFFANGLSSMLLK